MSTAIRDARSAQAAMAALRSADALSALDVQLARHLCALGDEHDERVALAVALASRQSQAGHVCVELDSLTEQAVFAEMSAVLGRPLFSSIDELRSALAASPLVACAPEGDAVRLLLRPLLLDPAGRLYLRRVYEQERGVAQAVIERVQSPPPSFDDDALRASLQRLFGPASTGSDAALATPVSAARSKKSRRDQLDLFAAATPQEQAATTEPDHQRTAAERAVRGRFTVVSGGPGTGKTFTVVKILALLIEQAHALRRDPPRVLLLAPTGKAAARLAESVRSAKAALPCAEEVKQAITEQASTLHRALGVRTAAGRRIGAAPARLLADVVVVDEASMVDLAMMHRLLLALSPEARLVLLGDKDQLASVEAGAVLGDICGDASAKSRGPHAVSLARCITVLTRSRRFGDDSAIKQLAEAIRAGDAEKAQAVLTRGHPEVSLELLAGELPEALLRHAVARLRPLFDAPEPAARLEALGQFRVLCAHRRGPLGVIEVNRRIEQALRLRGAVVGRGLHYPGRPILVTENSYDAKLWNGDVGVLWQGAAGLRACFPDPGQERTVREVPLARLPAHESVYAMSVHKSQGSEVDEVAVLLPAEDSPLLSRELLYTAVTRARRRVVVYASAASLAACIERRVARASGLREALWGAEKPR